MRAEDFARLRANVRAQLDPRLRARLHAHWGLRPPPPRPRGSVLNLLVSELPPTPTFESDSDWDSDSDWNSDCISPDASSNAPPCESEHSLAPTRKNSLSPTPSFPPAPRSPAPPAFPPPPAPVPAPAPLCPLLSSIPGVTDAWNLLDTLLPSPPPTGSGPLPVKACPGMPTREAHGLLGPLGSSRTKQSSPPPVPAPAPPPAPARSRSPLPRRPPDARRLRARAPPSGRSPSPEAHLWRRRRC